MRIGFIHNGDDIYCATRMMYFVKNGHEVFSFSFYSQHAQDLPPDINQIILSYFPFKYYFFKRFIHLIEIYYLVHKYKLDILHIVSMINGIYSICTNKAKVVLENMGSDVLILPNIYPIYRHFYKIIYKFAHAVIQDSYVSQNAGILYGASLINNKVIDVGVDLQSFSPKLKFGVVRNKLGISDDEKMVLFTRGSGKIYNIDTIIQTIPIVKTHFANIKYVFCDMRGDFISKYNSLIFKYMCIDNVFIAGNVNHFNHLPYYYRDADVVLSVPFSDSSPLSVYEAMACKTPVIISDLPWFKDKFKKDTDLMVVPVRNVKKLANAIIKVLSGKSNVNVDSAYEKVFKNINYITENRKLEQLYIKILNDT